MNNRPSFWECQALQLIPDPLASYEQWERLHHKDVTGLTDRALWREKRQIETVLAWAERPAAWLAERYRVLSAEESRRKRGRP